MLLFYVSPRLLEIIQTWALKGRGGGIFFRSKIDRGGGRGSYFSSPTFPEQTPLPKEHNKQTAPKCRQKRWWRRILGDPGADRGAVGKLGRSGNDGGGEGAGRKGRDFPSAGPLVFRSPQFPVRPTIPPPPPWVSEDAAWWEEGSASPLSRGLLVNVLEHSCVPPSVCSSFS